MLRVTTNTYCFSSCWSSLLVCFMTCYSNPLAFPRLTIVMSFKISKILPKNMHKSGLFIVRSRSPSYAYRYGSLRDPIFLILPMYFPFKYHRKVFHSRTRFVPRVRTVTAMIHRYLHSKDVDDSLEMANSGRLLAPLRLFVTCKPYSDRLHRLTMSSACQAEVDCDLLPT